MPQSHRGYRVLRMVYMKKFSVIFVPLWLFLPGLSSKQIASQPKNIPNQFLV